MIERLLGDLPPQKFLRDFYTRLPHSRPGGAAGFTSFSGWTSVLAILGAKEVDAFLAREGQMWEAGRCPTADETRREFARGHTLVIRSAEKHDAELERIAAGFRKDFAAPVNVHVYCTPAGQSGFGWHYDPEDVFIVQTHGSKEYQLRKNTVNPWPLLEQMPKDLRIEQEVQPLWNCVLGPGDWLYIPAGWWHSARGREGDSITLAIGQMTPAAVEVLDFLRRELLSSVIWRQRMPVRGAANPDSPEEQTRIHHSLFTDLGRDLSRTLADPAFAQGFLARKSPPP